MSCHVVWCGGHVIWCDVIACCVMSRDAMRCHVMCAHVMSCYLLLSVVPCNGMECYELKMPLVVRLRCVVRSGSVTMWWSKVLFCTTLYYKVLYSSTTLYYKVLLQYYSVLRSTTTYYSSATLYYNSSTTLYTTKYYCSTFLIFSVLQSTTPVLLCTTKYYNVRTTPALLCTTLQCSTHDWSLSHMNRYLHCAEQQQSSSNVAKYSAWHENHSHDWSASHMKRHLQCAEQHDSPSNLTHEKWLSWLILLTSETSFTMRGASGVILQPLQILRLARKMTLMIDPVHIWNGKIYNARSNKSHPPTSPNTTPATQNESHDWSASHMKRHLQSAEQVKSPSILTKYCACPEILSSRFEREIPEDDSTTIQRQNRHLAPAASETLLVPSWRRILYGRIQHFALRLSPKIARNAAPATKSDTPTSPNTAPATKLTLQLTKNDSHSWLILVTYETSFTMRSNTGYRPTSANILRLPRNSNSRCQRKILELHPPI